jgi:hypothetical protein
LVSSIQHQDSAATNYHADSDSYPTVFLKDVHRGPTVSNTAPAALHNRLQRLNLPTNDGRYVWFHTGRSGRDLGAGAVVGSSSIKPFSGRLATLWIVCG